MKINALFAMGLALSLGASAAWGQSSVVLVPAGSVWRFLDNGSDQGTAWRGFGFNDSTWSSGPAQLGYGDGDEATVVNGGPSNARYPTTYFRRSFVLSAATNLSSITVHVVRDDGAIVYLNGVEVFRSNMPGGAVNYLSFASSTVGGATESQYFSNTISAASLLLGTNVLAVELHQSDAGSTDVSFNLALTGVTAPATLPVLSVQPTNAAVPQGTLAQFVVGVAGNNGPIGFAWRKDGLPLAGNGRVQGVSTPALSLADLIPADAGDYSVVVSNASGSVTSAVAMLTVLAPPTTVIDDFDPDIDFSQWSQFSGTVRAGTQGGNVSPPFAMTFGGETERFAVTRPIDTTAGGFISFNIRMSDGTAGEPWDHVELPGEGVVFEYSINGGTNWIRLGTYDTEDLYSWTLEEMFMPAGALSPRTFFRWRQLQHSGGCCDHWALDDVYIESLPFPPMIVQEPPDRAVLEGGSVTFAVEAAGTPVLHYQWSFNNVGINNATNASYTVHGATSNKAGLYRVSIDNAIGSTSSREASLTVIDGSRDTFRITALTTNNSKVVETRPLSGAYLGGLAASGSRLLVSGQDATAALDLSDLGNGTSAPVVHNALLSDLRSGAVYTLATATGPLTPNGGLATRLLEVNGQSGQLTGNEVALSDPIPFSGLFYGSIGFFSGYGRAAVHNGTNVYTLFLSSGLVLDLGALPALNHVYSDTWAYWGVMEYFDDATWLTHVQDFRTIARTRAGDGLTQPLGTFRDLSTVAAFTAGLGSNRWYFQFAFQSEFGSGDHLAGYADAAFTFEQTTQAVSIVQGPRGRTVAVGATAEFTVSALGYPLRYQWLRNSTPLPGENGARLRLVGVTTNDVAIYSVIVSNELGRVTSEGAMLRVVPPVIVGIFDDPNYVDTFGGPYSGSDAVQASLISLGHQVAPFAVSNLTAALSAGRPVLFPALYYSDPARSFTPAQRQVVQNFVLNGGLIIVHGANYSASFLNSVFGLSLVNQFTGGGAIPRTAEAVGTGFVDGPDSLPLNSSYYGLLSSSVTLGARRAYETNGNTGVATLPLGSGRVVFLGWDWSNARPLGTQDGGWIEVLNAALLETRPPDPGPPSLALQPRDRPGVVGVDVPLNVIAYGTGPLSYQWFFNGNPIAGARFSSYTIALPTTNSSGGYFVIVSNLTGAVTSRVAQVSVRPSRGQAGYYTDFATDSTGPELSILKAGFTPVKITNPLSANFDPLRFIVLNESGFDSVSASLLIRLQDLTTWVQNGGRLIVHDLSSANSALMLGAAGTRIQIVATNSLTVVPPGNTLVTAGPYGLLTNGSFISSNYLAYTAADSATLPAGSVPILASGPTQTVAFAYGLGAGVVYYSSVLLAGYFDTELPESELLRSVYLPNTIEYVNAYTPAGPAVIVQPPNDTGVLPGGRLALAVYASGQAPLRYQWRFNELELAGATNASLVITGANLSHVGDYRVTVSNALGTTNSPPAHVSLLEARVFKINSLGTASSQVVDHDALTGDDRGGIAVSSNAVFITGDAATGRFSAANLSGGVSLPVVYDALIGNLRDETVYTLASGTNLIYGYRGAQVLDSLLQIDGNTGALTTNRLALSRSIALNGSEVGLFSGYDAAMLLDGVRAWRIDFHSGFVTDLGFMNAPSHQTCENWAYWGMAEFFNGSMWVMYVRDNRTISRTRIPDGFTETVGTFTSLSDMCSITFSTSRDRWYFHYEGSGQFGGQSETLGYASASWDRPPTIAGIASSTVAEDSTPFTIFLNLTDDTTPVTSLVLAATASDTNILSLSLGTVGGIRTLTVTPTPNRFGTSVVSLTVADVIGNVTARSFTFIVTPVNDPPSFTPGANVVVPEDSGPRFIPAWATQISGGPNESGQTVSFVISNSNPALFSQLPALNATGGLTFTPAPDASGLAILTIIARDDGGVAGGGMDTGLPRTFTITVDPVNDPPAATAQSVTTMEDTALALTLSGTDVEGNPLTFVVVSSPGHGTLSGAAPNLIYQPATNYHGPDSFTFRANDGQLESAPATVAIQVTPANDPPVVTPRSLLTDEDTPLSIVLEGSDPDGQTLTFTAVTSPAHGTLSGAAPNLIYTPDTNYAGGDGFTYQADDGEGGLATAEITLLVRAVNDAPSANDQSVTLDEDTPSVITLTASDVEGDAMTFSIVVAPRHGLLRGLPPNLTYQPDQDYHGDDNFSFQVSDGLATSAPALVALTVRPVNDPPVATALTVTTDQNIPVSFQLLGTDVDGEKLRYSIRTAPAHGRLSGKTAAQTYTPATGFHGTDSFEFQVSDGMAAAVATVTIVVRYQNEAPTAVARVVNLIFITPSSTRGAVISPNNVNGIVVLDGSRSSDPDGNPLQYSWSRAGVVFAQGIATTNLFVVGRHTVTLQVDDGQATGTASVELDVITATDALNQLITYVNSSSLPANRIRPLVSSLEAAAASFARGNMNSGGNQLGAFQNKVDAQVRPDNPSLAAILQASVQAILSAVGQ